MENNKIKCFTPIIVEKNDDSSVDQSSRTQTIDPRNLVSTSTAKVDKIEINTNPLKVYSYLDDPVHLQVRDANNNVVDGTLIPRHDAIYYFKKSQLTNPSVSDITRAVTGPDINGKTQYWVSKHGLFYNPNAVPVGHFPIKLDLVGSESNYTINLYKDLSGYDTTSTWGVSIQKYSGSYGTIASIPGLTMGVNPKIKWSDINSTMTSTIDDNMKKPNTLHFLTIIGEFDYTATNNLNRVWAVISSAPILYSDAPGNGHIVWPFNGFCKLMKDHRNGVAQWHSSAYFPLFQGPTYAIYLGNESQWFQSLKEYGFLDNSNNFKYTGATSTVIGSDALAAAMSSRVLDPKNDGDNGRNVKVMAKAGGSFGFQPLRRDLRTTPSSSNAKVYGTHGLFAFDKNVYCDGYLVGTTDDLKSGYDSKLYYNNGWFLKIDAPRKWKDKVAYWYKTIGGFTVGLGGVYEDNITYIGSRFLPREFWEEFSGKYPHPNPTNDAERAQCYAWFVDQFVENLSVYIYQYNPGNNDSFGTMPACDASTWNYGQSMSDDYDLVYYDFNTKTNVKVSYDEWVDRFKFTGNDGVTIKPTQFILTHNYCGYGKNYKQFYELLYYSEQGQEWERQDFRMGGCWLGIPKLPYSNTIPFTQVYTKRNWWDTMNGLNLKARQDMSVLMYPKDDWGERFCFIPTPNGRYAYTSDNCQVTIDRKYNPNNYIYTRNPGIRVGHYTTQEEGSPVIMTSAILQDAIDKSFSTAYTDDYLISLILTKDEETTKIIKDANPSLTKAELVEDIISDVKTSVNSSNLFRADDPKMEIIINDLRNTLESSDDNVSPIASRFDKFGLPHIFDEEEFFSYRFTVAAHAAEEGALAIFGHNRVIGTNPTESPIYQKLVDIGIDESKMKYYSMMLSQMGSTMYGTDVNALVDTMDLYNEISLLSSITSQQLSVITDSIDQITKALEGSNDPASDDKLKSLFSNFSNVSNDIANSLMDASVQINNIVKEGQPGTYDHTLISRNTFNATKYSISLADAIKSDPYLAVQQHNAYISERMKNLADKLNMMNLVINSVDKILQIPNLLLDGLKHAGKLAGKLINIAIKGATNTVKVIDNIDKLVFIDETFVSKGIVEYSTMPSFTDDIFTKPIFGNEFGSSAQYDRFQKKAEVNLATNSNIAEYFAAKLKQMDIDKPFEANGGVIKYNDYDVSRLVTDVSGYLLPLSGQFPIIKLIKNSDGSTSQQLLPNLMYNKSLSHPFKGDILHIFLNQLAYFERDDVKDDISKLSKYIPITPGIESAYIWIVAGLTVASGIAGAISGIMKGDPIKAILGGISAAAATATVNGIALDEIFAMRTFTHEVKSVYTYFNYKLGSFASTWGQNLTPEFMAKNYDYVLVNQFIPLYQEASDYKKTFLMIKEVIALIANTVSMFAVSYCIGLITGALVDSARLIKERRILAKQRDYENTLALQNKDEINQTFDKNRQEILDRTDLTDQQKQDMIDQLDIDKINYNRYIDGKIKLNGKERWRLNQVLATNYGLPPLVTAPATSSSVAKLVSVGALTSESIKGIVDQVNDYNKKLQEDTGDSFQDIVNNQEEQSGILNAIISITGEMSDKLLGLVDDVRIIKKYV